MAWYSHERIYEILKRTDEFGKFFDDSWIFHSFSIFPVTLIITALVTHVFAAFSLGRTIYLFRQKQKIYKDKDKFKLDAQKYLRNINETIRLTSLIMVSSKQFVLSYCSYYQFLI